MKQVVKVSNLKKTYGNTQAVKDVSFELNEGEIVGFLGPNGAGKSTTIRCLLGLSIKDEGEINIFGEEVTQTNIQSLKNQIGFIPGELHLYENLTGKQHLNMVTSMRSEQPDQKFLEELIERYIFDPSKKVKNLSTGNKQKLGLIIAFMYKPKLLVLDESTAGLDPLLQNTTYEILKDFKNNGHTIFMSSHIISEVEKTCDRAYIIKGGEIISKETIGELQSKRVYEINISFDKGHKPDEFDAIKSIENVIDFRRENGNVEITIRGSVKPVLDVLPKYNYKDIEIDRSDLDKIFIEFYE